MRDDENVPLSVNQFTLSEKSWKEMRLKTVFVALLVLYYIVLRGSFAKDIGDSSGGPITISCTVHDQKTKIRPHFDFISRLREYLKLCEHKIHETSCVIGQPLCE